MAIKDLINFWLFTKGKDLKYYIKETNNKFCSNLVFVYDKTLINNEPIIYSSINKATKSLSISYANLIECISNKYLLKDNLILSFEPLNQLKLNVKLNDYSYKTEGDKQLIKNIFFNQENELVFEFKSAREMARHFKIDAKLARNPITKGEYLNYTLVYIFFFIS